MAAPTEQITLYTAKICPYAQRTEIALAEAGVDYTRFEIDLGNKPEWYASKINPASKVPAIAYGGPPVPASQPPQSTKLAESLVLLEFLSDIHPSTPTLLPRDPVKRARARFFIDAVSTKFVLGEKEAIGGLMEGVESVMRLLPSLEAKGQTDGKGSSKRMVLEQEGKQDNRWTQAPSSSAQPFSIADAAIAPFALRWELSLSNDIGAYEEGEGKKVWEVLSKEPRYERFRKYLEALKGRESVWKTFDRCEFILQVYTKRFGDARAQRKANKAKAA
ncbi:hypothetical protein K435DRAFT_785737 [Dendrothele bispora CBS 962.96]|uniref:GST N-terminal domain-containing protein n=1 Tax=Dendrothele bispora (strain CBS 962.96) TaxID=1314807 RepID=A0A4S8KUX8_DENBC|nr:hypothetical protein K435DRAFT_785737 [Dendrothele bispora CBS 962.96]